MANNQPQRIRVASLIESGVLAINDGYRVKNSELGRIGIPFVRGGDIGDGWIDTNVDDHIRSEFADRVTSKLTKPGDVAFITKGTVGRVGRIREGQPAVVLAPQVAFWRSLDETKLNSRFLFYLLKGSEFQSNLDAVKTHGSMVADYVSMTDQKLFYLTLPPIKEQQRAADILGTLDDKIELNRRMNETLEAMARRLFRSWFVDFDPVHAKAALRRQHPKLSNPALSRRALPDLDPKITELFPDSFEDSTLGPIPKGWQAGTIEDLAALDKTSVNPSAFPEEVFDHYSIPAFDNGRNPVREAGDQIKSNKFVVADDFVLLTKLNPRIPRVWLPYPSTSRRSLCSTEFLVLKPQSAIPREYIFSFVSSAAFFEVYETMVTGTSGSHQRVRPEHLLKLNVVIPSDRLQCEFAQQASLLYQRSDRLRHESLDLSKTRDRLLPRLLSGELPVPAA